MGLTSFLKSKFKRRKAVKKTKEEKEILRKANEKVKQVHNIYKGSGHKLTPFELTGTKQMKKQWHTKTQPFDINISTKQDVQEAKMILSLRDVESYQKDQQEKVIQGIETSLSDLGGDDFTASEELKKRIEEMDIVELSDFWNEFTIKAERVGVEYSSDAVMIDTIESFFEDDIEYLLEIK